MPDRMLVPEPDMMFIITVDAMSDDATSEVVAVRACERRSPFSGCPRSGSRTAADSEAGRHLGLTKSTRRVNEWRAKGVVRDGGGGGGSTVVGELVCVCHNCVSFGPSHWPEFEDELPTVTREPQQEQEQEQRRRIEQRQFQQQNHDDEDKNERARYRLCSATEMSETARNKKKAKEKKKSTRERKQHTRAKKAGFRPCDFAQRLVRAATEDGPAALEEKDVRKEPAYLRPRLVHRNYHGNLFIYPFRDAYM